MISTHSSYSAPFSFSNDGGAFQNWRCVDLTLNFPYFFIEFECIEDQMPHRQSKIVCRGEDLIELCTQIREQDNLTLTQIALLNPSTRNSNRGWTLININQILEADFEEFNQATLIYVADDGVKYADYLDSERLNLAKNTRTLFQLGLQ
jgi:hypothetical protein